MPQRNHRHRWRLARIGPSTRRDVHELVNTPDDLDRGSAASTGLIAAVAHNRTTGMSFVHSRPYAVKPQVDSVPLASLPTVSDVIGSNPHRSRHCCPHSVDNNVDIERRAAANRTDLPSERDIKGNAGRSNRSTSTRRRTCRRTARQKRAATVITPGWTKQVPHE